MASHQYYLTHKPRYKASLNKSQQRKQEFINRMKSRPCLDCGIQYNPWIMQFDHRVPIEKSFNIAEKKNCFGYDVLEKEMAKCDVVCANCHAERTHKQWVKE